MKHFIYKVRQTQYIKKIDDPVKPNGQGGLWTGECCNVVAIREVFIFGIPVYKKERNENLDNIIDINSILENKRTEEVTRKGFV